MAQKKTTKSTRLKAADTLSAEERAALKETIRERKAAQSGNVDGESEIAAKIAEMPEPDRSLAQRVHEMVKAAAPELAPRTWYGMPAYSKDGKVLCFFQPASKFKARYATFGFSPEAKLDDGSMWPTSFALTELTPDAEARITALVKQATS